MGATPNNQFKIPESIHRSSVMEAAQSAIAILLERYISLLFLNTALDFSVCFALQGLWNSMPKSGS
jgi:hypothetical protein